MCCFGSFYELFIYYYQLGYAYDIASMNRFIKKFIRSELFKNPEL